MQYPIKTAFQNLWQGKWLNILSMLTMATGLLVISIVLVLIYNVTLFTRKLPEQFSIMAYLKDNISEQETQLIVNSLKNRPNVEKVNYISKIDALKELKTSIKNADYVLEGLNENPLPASLEIRLKKEAVNPEIVRQFVADIKKIKDIEDIQYGEKLLSSIQFIKTGMQTLGLFVMVLMTAGITFICYSTIKILFYRKKEEVETLKLLGATSCFIRAPFILEGGIIGATGGLISMLTLFIFYSSVFYSLSSELPFIKYIALPPLLFFSLPAAGLCFGITGSLIAIGRIKY